jgi:hypothetical protein
MEVIKMLYNYPETTRIIVDSVNCKVDKYGTEFDGKFLN